MAGTPNGELMTGAEIVLKALAKAPADRYATASDFAADIQRFLDHQPIRARRPSLIDRMAKWSRRHPSLVVAGVLLLAVIAAASLISNRLIATEQKLTSEALDREKKKAVEAEDRFQQAREAVDSLFQVSEEELIDKPFDGARQRILEIVLGHYQDFIEQRRGDAESQAEESDELEVVSRCRVEHHGPVLGHATVGREVAGQPPEQIRRRFVERWSVLEAAGKIHDLDERRARAVLRPVRSVVCVGGVEREPLQELGVLLAVKIDDGAKRGLFARVHGGLAPGGVFVNAEQVSGPTGLFDDAYERWHEAAARALGASDEEWRGYERRRVHDRWASAERQLAWLRPRAVADADSHRLSRFHHVPKTRTRDGPPKRGVDCMTRISSRWKVVWR